MYATLHAPMATLQVTTKHLPSRRPVATHTQENAAHEEVSVTTAEWKGVERARTRTGTDVLRKAAERPETPYELLHEPRTKTSTAAKMTIEARTRRQAIKRRRYNVNDSV